MSQPSAVPALRVVSCVRWAAPAAKTATLAWLLWFMNREMSRQNANACVYDSGRLRERCMAPQGRAIRASACKTLESDSFFGAV